MSVCAGTRHVRLRSLSVPDPRGAGNGMTDEVSEAPRVADIEQLQAAYLMHRQECRQCTRKRSCPMGRRLEEAFRKAEST
ncbi:hypothetical protein GCM10009680_68990 [Streptomyces yatensis]|uniref:Uncharacterized protein n=1 Tax=Streptomyces yatensis TaxID=155177 RepID=A0ABN2J4H1_9ACTN